MERLGTLTKQNVEDGGGQWCVAARFCCCCCFRNPHGHERVL